MCVCGIRVVCECAYMCVWNVCVCVCVFAWRVKCVCMWIVECVRGLCVECLNVCVCVCVWNQPQHPHYHADLANEWMNEEFITRQAIVA